jgi:hypothetical protein
MTVAPNENVANGVEWIEQAAHPLAGSCRRKADFLAHAHRVFGEALPQGTQLHIESVLVSTRGVIVTMWFLPMAKIEPGFGYRYWWICDR